MLKKVLLLCALVLFVAVFDLPYGYYQFTRIAVFATSIYAIYNKRLQILFAVVAILFNPIVLITFTRPIWRWVDVLVGIFFLVTSTMIHFQEQKRKRVSAEGASTTNTKLTSTFYETNEPVNKPRKKINKGFVMLAVALIIVISSVAFYFVYQQRLNSYNDLIDLMEYRNEEMDKNIKLFNEIKIINGSSWKNEFSYVAFGNYYALDVNDAEEYLRKIDDFVFMQIKVISEPKNVKLLNQFGQRQKTEDEIIAHLTSVYQYLDDRKDTYDYLVDHANSSAENGAKVEKANIVLRSYIPYSDPYYAFGLKKY